MKKIFRVFIALLFFITQTGGADLAAGGKSKKKKSMDPPAPTEAPADATAAKVVKDPALLKSVSLEEGRLRISLSRLVPYKVNLLSKPWRLVVEFSNTINKAQPPVQKIGGELVKQIRVYQYGKKTKAVGRVVLDLSEPIEFKAYPRDNDIFLVYQVNDALKTLEEKPPSMNIMDNLPNDKIDLDFEQEDVLSALKLMGELSGINLIYSPDVSGPITLHLKQVPFDQAFRTLLTMKNLVARQLGGNILWILTPSSLNASRESAQLETKTFAINYAEAGTIQTHLDTLRKAGNRKGSTMVDERTNMLVVTDTPEGLREAERLLALFDKKPAQILIEARIVEINLDNALDLGIQWELAYGNKLGSGGSYGLGVSEASDDPPKGTPAFRSVNPVSGDTEYIRPLTPGEGRATGIQLPPASNIGAITFGFIKDPTMLISTLSFLSQKNKSRILSAPKIVTINSQMARIEASQQIPFPVTSVTGTGVSTQSFEFVSAGIILEVTPTVNPKGQVTLKLRPTVSFPIAGLTSVGPTIRNRSANTTVIVNDGDTIAIGGLIDETDTLNVQKLPILGDIPILGMFFRRKLKSKTRSELLVFITPRILKD